RERHQASPLREACVMLTSTFCHIFGVAKKTEHNLWKAGVTSWDCSMQLLPAWLPRPLRESWGPHIEASVNNYSNRNAGYCAEQLPRKEHWRLYRDFQDSCAFVDIETTGLGWWDEITTIVLYDGRTIRCYVQGDNLEQFCEDIENYSLLVT